MQCCSLQHRTLLLSPVTSTSGIVFALAPSLVFLKLFLYSSPGAYWASTDLVSSSFTVRSLLPFQLSAEQLLTGECWILPKKDTPCPRAKEKINKMVGGGKSCLESNPIPVRDAQRAQTKPCAHQDPKAVQRLSQTCLLESECLLQRHRSAVTCHWTGALAAADLGHAACA